MITGAVKSSFFSTGFLMISRLAYFDLGYMPVSGFAALHDNGNVAARPPARLLI
jgi:hypothetical protein